MLEWIVDQGALLGWLATLLFLTFVGTLIAVLLLVARIPEDYFVRRHRRRLSWWEQHPVLRVVSVISKNAFGLLFIVAGLAMLVLPGQGIITIVVGLLLIDFPGKFRLERWLARRRQLMRGINWIRLRSGRPPLPEPKRPDTAADGGVCADAVDLVGVVVGGVGQLFPGVVVAEKRSFEAGVAVLLVVDPLPDSVGLAGNDEQISDPHVGDRG